MREKTWADWLQMFWELTHGAEQGEVTELSKPPHQNDKQSRPAKSSVEAHDRTDDFVCQLKARCRSTVLAVEAGRVTWMVISLKSASVFAYGALYDSASASEFSEDSS